MARQGLLSVTAVLGAPGPGVFHGAVHRLPPWAHWKLGQINRSVCWNRMWGIDHTDGTVQSLR